MLIKIDDHVTGVTSWCNETLDAFVFIYNSCGPPRASSDINSAAARRIRS